MLRVAITGGIACGKSVVGSLFDANGIPTCDSDELAHRAILKGKPAYSRILKAFGRTIVGSDGEIVRARLGKLVFGHPERLARLNSIVHPEVKVMWKAWLRGLRAKAAAAVIIPLLYETGLESDWDAVVCVGAPDCERVARLRVRGLSAGEINQRLAAQMPVWEKMEMADHVIFNGGSMELLREQTVRVITELLERKHA